MYWRLDYKTRVQHINRAIINYVSHLTYVVLYLCYLNIDYALNTLGICLNYM